MNHPVASIKSSAPLAMLTRYFRRIDGVSLVESHGIDEDFGIDLLFNECKFYIDRQFGIVQLYVQNESCDNKSIDLFVSHFKSIPRGIFSALMSMVCLDLFVPRGK